MPTFHVLGLGAIGAIIANSLQELQTQEPDLDIEIVPILRNLTKCESFHKNNNAQLVINQLYHKPEPKKVISQPFTLTTCPELIVQKKEYISNLVVTTKTYQTVEALKPMWESHIINEKTNIILIQNGIGMLDDLHAAFPEIVSKNFKIFQGVISHGVFMEKYPNEFNHAGYMNLKMALINDSENKLNGLQSVEELNKLNLENELVKIFTKLNLDVKSLSFQELIVGQIEKFCVNCCINSNTTILNCLNGHLLFNEVETKKLFKSIITEIATLFAQSEKYSNIFKYYQVIAEQKENSTAEYPDTVDLTKLNNIDLLLDFVVDAGCIKNYDNSSSMRQDALNKRDTEIDYINGYVVKLCLEDLKLPVQHCSVNSTVVTLTKIKSSLLKKKED